MNLRIVVVGFLLSPFAFLQSSLSQSWRELHHEADSVNKTDYGAAIPHALDIAKQALVKAEQEFGAPDSNVADILDLCAQLLVDPSVWKPTEAQSCAERSLEINEKVFGPDHPRVTEALGTLAGTGTYRKHPHEAMILLERARSIYQKAGQTHTREYASCAERISAPLQIAENVPRNNVYQLRNVRPGCASFSDLVVPRLHGTRTEGEAIGR